MELPYHSASLPSLPYNQYVVAGEPMVVLTSLPHHNHWLDESVPLAIARNHLEELRLQLAVVDILHL